MRVSRLARRDLEAVARLVADDGGYVLRVSGRPAGAADAGEILMALPPGVEPGAKHVLGLEDGGDLVGIADVIRGWPERQYAHVGLLQVAAARHGRGLGRVLHDAVVERAADWPEVTTLRLGIVDTNREQAEPFWRALEYCATGESKPHESGTVRSTTRIWTRPVKRSDQAFG